MTDFSKILDKAKELEAKMKESQQKIKEIRVEGVSGSNSVRITLDGEGEMQTIKLSDENFIVCISPSPSRVIVTELEPETPSTLISLIFC